MPWMGNERKRKAKDQLSPYSGISEERTSHAPEEEPSIPIARRKAKARIGCVADIEEPSLLKGVLSSVNILKPVLSKDRVSGLNKCFLKALQIVVETESNKNLAYLFKQYERYYEELTNGKD